MAMSDDTITTVKKPKGGYTEADLAYFESEYNYALAGGFRDVIKALDDPKFLTRIQTFLLEGGSGVDEKLHRSVLDVFGEEDFYKLYHLTTALAFLKDELRPFCEARAKQYDARLEEYDAVYRRRATV
jgi:hypothetical protein